MIKNKKKILQDILECLDRLVSILTRDSACRWTKRFLSLQGEARLLQEKGFSDEEFKDFCGEIRSTLQGGMGSYNDYAPMQRDPKSGKASPLPDSEDFEMLNDKLYDLANEIRVIGQY